MVARIIRCKEAFAFEENGMNRVVHAGELVSSDDDAFKNHKDLFEDVETHFDRQKKMAALAAKGNRADEEPPVEQATNAPGEKRVTPARQTVAVKAATKPDETGKDSK